jgi:hypothetical protein
MTENFFHYPDNTIFHGISENQQGFSFADSRTLTDDSEKISKLKRRLADYYLKGLSEMTNPFTIAILTCVGIEVLGQVVLGFNSEGETIENNTVKIYELLDPKMCDALSTNFKTNYNLKRNLPGLDNDKTSSFTSYARVVRRGLRNAFTHTYRSLGVVLSDSLLSVMLVQDNDGLIIINPYLFRQKFIDTYENCFESAITNSNTNYRNNALKYFELLIK